VPVATSSPDAYSLYLQATAIFNRRDGARFADAIADLERAIALDPKFARAFSRLAVLYDVAPQYSEFTDLKAARDATQHYANAAIALDPTLAEPHAALALSDRIDHRYIEEHEGYERALALDPDDVTTNFWFSLTLLMDGYTRRGMQLLDRALSIDPMLPNALRWRAKMHLAAGDLDAAEADAQKARDRGLQIAGMNLAEIAHARGHDRRAREHWIAGMQGYLQGMPDDSATVIADGLYGDDAARRRAIAAIDAYLAGSGEEINWVAPYVLVQLGEPEKALAAMRTRRTNNDADFLGWLWSPSGRATRMSAEFPAFAREMGLTKLWDVYGPPDLCRKDAPETYTCD
jgi:tetratricopeptide (TPR) repeat protein